MKLLITKSRKRTIIGVAVLVVAVNASSFAANGTWTPTASVHTPRDGHTATLLPNRNVVIAGGENNNQALNPSEVYSPTFGLWTRSGNLNVARANAGAVLLPNGAVLIAGGCVSDCLGATTATSELYSSLNGKWTETGAMATARTYFSLVLLRSGEVLVAGGCTGLNANGCSGVTSKAEIYNPSTGTWTATGSMTTARGNITATLLHNGEVLVAGGINAAGDPLGTAELYNPVTGKWTATGRMITARDEHTATLLATGNVLVVGGEDASGLTTTKTELYNPSTGKWTETGNLNTSGLEHTATTLMNGEVLITGGANVTANTTTVLSSAELYNPATGKWTKTESMSVARVGHTATLLTSGKVLATSGSDANNDWTSAELYHP
jgi:N-acetylneuraminic acid mutarotase